ncbi:3-isopropylmalate dehydratase small subunit [bacterium]|nr:3-isopropylmalate dehydratase small subunit [bacterium]MBU1064547.1 3-isopropylmalate dehydratase small subunit [bacterium]MBU1633415.1 3-isopropylmalate dehydratase small subunit [bacterium]MBU1873345.1 3-isopropylmalate dehydratase small subunit [bacterium]
MTGNAHCYKRDHINTDEIIPARYLNMDKEADLAKHAMEDIDVDFLNKVKTGDMIIAGEDFGCGSSREHAVWALRGAGIRAVIADTFGRIFYRNCINNGFIAIECKGISDKVDSGDKLEIDIENGVINNMTKKEQYEFLAIPEFAREIIAAGGLLNYIVRKS